MASQPQKVWFITGSSSRFGGSLIQELLSRNQIVIATARNGDKLEHLKTLGAAILGCDVTKPFEDLVKVAEKAHSLYNRIDVLINNAGFSLQGTMQELTQSQMQTQLNTNVFGTINVTKAFLPYFRAQRFGTIANVSSMGAWRGTPGLGIYEASKWFVSGLTKTLKTELADFGTGVICIEPGSFRSNFLTSGDRKVDESRIKDYDGTAARKVAEFMANRDGKQPGDLKKAAKVIVDVLMSKEGKELPLRLPVGKDAYETIKAKCEATLELLEEWRDGITAINIEEEVLR